MGTDTVSFKDVEAIAQTAKALKVVINGKEYWFPQSTIHEDSEVWKEGQTGKFVVTRFIAEKKGLVEEDDDES